MSLGSMGSRLRLRREGDPMTIGSRLIVLIFEGDSWRAASFKDIEKRDEDLLAGKKTGATAIIKVHAESEEEEEAILAALGVAFDEDDD